MTPLEKLRKKVDNRKRFVVSLCFSALSQVALGLFFIRFVLTDGGLLYENFALSIPENASAVFIHPISILVFGGWFFIQGVYIFITAIANGSMTMERVLLQHIDKDS